MPQTNFNSPIAWCFHPNYKRSAKECNCTKQCHNLLDSQAERKFDCTKMIIPRMKNLTEKIGKNLKNVFGFESYVRIGKIGRALLISINILFREILIQSYFQSKYQIQTYLNKYWATANLQPFVRKLKSWSTTTITMGQWTISHSKRQGILVDSYKSIRMLI